MSSKKAK